MSRDRNGNVDSGDRMCPSEWEHVVVRASQDFTPNRSVLLQYVLKKRQRAIGHVKMDAGESVSRVWDMFRCSVTMAWGLERTATRTPSQSSN